MRQIENLKHEIEYLKKELAKLEAYKLYNISKFDYHYNNIMAIKIRIINIENELKELV